MANKIWNVGAYTRLSRDDGDKSESESISSHKEIIRDYIKDRKDMVIINEYVDNGWTGTNTNRPEFQRLLEDINKGKIRALVIKDFSRFSRDYIESGNLLENVFSFFRSSLYIG